MTQKEKPEAGEKTVIKKLGLGGTQGGGAACRADQAKVIEKTLSLV